jgi:hypothetical protein
MMSRFDLRLSVATILFSCLFLVTPGSAGEDESPAPDEPAIQYVSSKDLPLIDDAFVHGFLHNLVNENVKGTKMPTLTVGCAWNNRHTENISIDRDFFSVWTRDLYWGFLGWPQAGDDQVLDVMKSSLRLLTLAKAKNQAVGLSKSWPLDDKRFYIPQAWVTGLKTAMDFMPYNAESQADFLLMARDYWRLSGDGAFIESIWPDICYVTKTIELMDTNGNSLPDHLYGSYDYQGVGPDTEEPLMSAKAYGAYGAVAELATALGDVFEAKRLEALADRVRDQMNKPVAEGGLWKPDGEEGGYFVNMRFIAEGRERIDDSFIPYENLVPIFFGVTTPGQEKAVFRRLDGDFEKYYGLKYGPMYLAAAATKEDSEFPFTSAPWLGFLDVYLRCTRGIETNRDRIFGQLLDHAYDIPGVCFSEGLGIYGTLSGVSGRSWDNGNFFHTLITAIYGLKKSKDGIEIGPPTQMDSASVTELQNVRWRQAVYNFEWRGTGDRIDKVVLDGKEIESASCDAPGTGHAEGAPPTYRVAETEGEHKVVVFTQAAETEEVRWKQLYDIKKTEGGYLPSGGDPWMLSENFTTPVTTDRCYLSLEMTASAPCQVFVYWWKSGEVIHFSRMKSFHFPASAEPSRQVIDLGTLGTFKGAEAIRLGVRGGLYDIRKLEFLARDEVPDRHLSQLVEFRCFTSKLHFLPGETIEYRATLLARNYPDRQSSKILNATLLNGKGEKVASHTQHYGLADIQQIKEIQGTLPIEGTLPPGTYRLVTTSTDQRSGLVLSATHELGVQGPDAPFLLETPFKFVKDHSIIRGEDGLWHLFSITGDLAFGHDWVPDGHERTFSHATSPDLVHWTDHPPVLSIDDKPYADGKGRFRDRNIWAPHVIRHDGLYYMFYTSINSHVSQSVSLATSKDLFAWQDYEKNPVSTPANAEWASWGRGRWGDYRDPMVLADEGKFYLYVTSQAKEGDLRGTVSVAESDDLLHWTTPKIAVRGNIISESPQVWKAGGTYYMVTSSLGGATYSSDHPVEGWKRTAFPLPSVPSVEKYVGTSGGYAQEIVPLQGGTFLMSGTTFRHFGNSLYFFRMKTDEEGRPASYESPFSEETAEEQEE